MPAGQGTAIHCLMIPLSNDILLLPNAAVAEVSAYLPPESPGDAPDWYLGQTTWRDYRIPVVAFELLNGDVSGKVTVTKNSRIAVLNTLNGNPRLPYIGLLTQGIPRLQVVQNKSLEANSSMEGRHDTCVAEFVLVNGEPVTIPDIDFLEKSLVELS